METKRTKETKSVQQVVASLAVDGMYLNKEFVRELVKAGNSEKALDALRKEVIKKYS